MPLRYTGSPWAAALLSLSLGSLLPAAAQDRGLWHDQQAPSARAAAAARYIVPDQARYVDLSTAALRGRLAQARTGTLLDLPTATEVIELPMPDGTFRAFRYLETPLMHPDLQARYPMVRTYTGVAVDDASVTLKFDLTPAGFHAMVLGVRDGDVFIDPVSLGDDRDHQVYRRSDLRRGAQAPAFTCGYDAVNDLAAAREQTRHWIEQAGAERTGDCRFRTYRLALACTAEYATFFGATAANKAPAIAAMATSLNRVNGLYERDAALTMVLVANNDQLVFTNSTTDGYSNNNGDAMLGENQTKCDNVIGSANYDIGHVFSTGGGGVAYLNSPCTNIKAGGVTGSSAPVGDPFDVDYVAHEMGHQYGGNHTQNNNCNRVAGASVEVGSGITIMGYAGVCPTDVAPHSDAMFGGYSLVEIHANIVSGNSSGCPQTVSLVNSPPTANAGADYTIPKSTPFVLTGSATDVNASNVLTYSWEQMNSTFTTQPPVATSTGGPNFRPFLPVTSPSRYIPNLATLASGVTPSPNWEVLSSVARTYAFRFTVRDNATGGGCITQDDMQVTVNGTAGPFVVTQPNTALSWAGLSTQTVTWNVAGTTASPVSCANVDILLSLDGGLTYPYTLLTGTPNDGTQAVTLPDVASTTARMMVKANGNIFFDISNVNFTITAAPQVRVSAKAWLDGAYDSGSGQMRDDLRAAGLVPTGEPYTALGFAQVGNGGGETCSAGVLAVTGGNAVVDWVRLELRSSAVPSTLVCSRQALLQRDGDIVDTDGTSPVSFSVASGSYYVAVRHRNHLGAMTAAAVALTSSATTVDLRSNATATYGTEARKAVGAAMVLWCGNVFRDATLKYTGANNDRDPILVRIGGAIPTATITGGYYLEDTNLDGTVKYTGASNDRDPILSNVGGSVPTATRTEQLP
ncbi:MAG: hypothetical protein JST66_14970 [Bacteroidetes bacterium]|nr:hypothetical protein [Bacteroidota bacterium]